jgi:putative oxidoreductase
MKELSLVGRLLFGGFLLFSSAHHFTQASALSHAAALHGVPFPTAAVLVAGVLLLVAAVSFLLGVVPRIGVAALVLFLVPVTLTMHQFWNETGMARLLDLINFTKNVALLGGGLMALAIPEPWPYSVHLRGHVPRHARA